MKFSVQYLYLLILPFVMGCNKKEKQTSITKITFEVFSDSSVHFLKIELQNLNKYGIYFPEFYLSEIIFLNCENENISHRIFNDTYRNYEPIWLSNELGMKECMDTLIAPSVICWDNDSLLKYQDTEIGKILFQACQNEYELFLQDNNLDKISDSIFIKNCLLYKYFSSEFIKPHSSIHWCFNIKYIMRQEPYVKVIFHYIPKEMKGFQYFKYPEYDSLKVRNRRLKEIDGFYLIDNEIISDTFLIK